jgi:hypothetical protein
LRNGRRSCPGGHCAYSRNATKHVSSFAATCRRIDCLQVEGRGPDPIWPSDYFVLVDSVRGANKFAQRLVPQRHPSTLLEDWALAKRSVRLIAIDSKRGRLELRGRRLGGGDCSGGRGSNGKEKGAHRGMYQSTTLDCRGAGSNNSVIYTTNTDLTFSKNEVNSTPAHRCASVELDIPISFA